MNKMAFIEIYKKRILCRIKETDHIYYEYFLRYQTFVVFIAVFVMLILDPLQIVFKIAQQHTQLCKDYQVILPKA